MDKVLLVARLGKFFSDFEISNIELLQELGYEVWCAGNFEGDNHKLDVYHVHKVHVDLVRSPLSKINLRGYRQLVRLMQEHNFKLVHCHMPVGGVIARLAANKTHTNPVIYTAHGFQFVKGGPKRDWVIFYPIEKFMSRYTDVLITINHEDYQIASRKFFMKRAVYLHGIGIDLDKFSNGQIIRRQLLEKYRILYDRYLLLSVGELSKRKNHEAALRGLALYIKSQKGTDLSGEAKRKLPHYFICGIGGLEEYLKDLCKKLEIEAFVTFLGWREDIADLCRSVDAFVFPSKREGLPVALMEAMAAGLPCIVSKARGNTELIRDGENGIVCQGNLPEEYAEAMGRIQAMDLQKAGETTKRILQSYKKSEIVQEMRQLYKSVGL